MTASRPLSSTPVEPGESSVAGAVLDVAGHLLGADQQALDLWLAGPRGGPRWPHNFDRMRRKFKAEQGLEIRFHDLRHTQAIQLLSAGVNVKVITERLGHASIGITLDTYSHVMPGMQEEAAEKIDAGLRAALAG